MQSLSKTPVYAPPNIPIWVLIIYGQPFLLENFPPTDSALLADYYLILTFSRDFSKNIQTRSCPTL
jgi:hypothetical protein